MFSIDLNMKLFAYFRECNLNTCIVEKTDFFLLFFTFLQYNIDLSKLFQVVEGQRPPLYSVQYNYSNNSPERHLWRDTLAGHPGDSILREFCP